MRFIQMKSLAAIGLLLLLQPANAQEGPVTIPNDTEFRIRMTSSVSTRSNKAGDTIAGVVMSPEEFKGATVEGEIKEATSSGKINKKSTLNFAFKSMVLGGKILAIDAQVKSMVNSKGKENVDEEGRIIEKKGNSAKVALMTGGGAVLGGLLGGGAKGAAIGAGVGAAASLIFVSVGVKGPEIHFDPGSEFILTVRERRPSAQPQ